MEGIFDAISDNCVSSVCTTVEPGANVIVLGQNVDKLALAFIAPL